jgi:hypothetical protein
MRGFQCVEGRHTLVNFFAGVPYRDVHHGHGEEAGLPALDRQFALDWPPLAKADLADTEAETSSKRHTKLLRKYGQHGDHAPGGRQASKPE